MMCSRLVAFVVSFACNNCLVCYFICFDLLFWLFDLVFVVDFVYFGLVQDMIACIM